MPGILISSASGIAFAVRDPRAKGTSGSRPPWITTAGTSDPAMPRFGTPEARMAPSWRAVPPARGSGRTSAAASSRSALVARPVGRRPDHPEHAREVRRCRRRGRFGARRISTLHTRSFGVPTRRSPVVDIIEASDSTRSGCLDRHRLGDHPAHRGADHVGALDAEVVEQADGVGGHVGQQVRHLRRQAGHQPPHVRAPAPRSWSRAPRRGCRTGSRGSRAPRTARTAPCPSGSAASRDP